VLKKHLLAAICLASALALAMPGQRAEAFCGFYVSGADAKLYNNATQVVMMREGTRTVLSIQNNYRGPASDFAMVIPVPVVLQKENVKTLSKEIFDKVDSMAAPRLVEYWEIDPCAVPEEYEDDGILEGAMDVKSSAEPVKVEAKFEVGEYQVVILSANDSGALDKWLRAEKYNIPAGAEPVLRSYVEQGTKFFVAKVDAKKVKFEGGQAVLSPLRFFYDTKDFNLPIRLGMLNAKGHQDLIVHILAKGQRYEVANYKNVTIPTNIGVSTDAKGRFGEFYAALFDRTLEKNPGAVVTEYAWDAATCDPCPGPTLSQADFMTLGADALPSKQAWGFVLTRLHARYTKDNLGEDLVFKAAPPIVGGREFRKGGNGELEKGSAPGGRNNFQGRYIIRHPWKGEIKCENPTRGRWGGPTGKLGSKPPSPTAAKSVADAPRGKLDLPSVVREDIPELGLKMAGAGVEKPAGEGKVEESGSEPPAADGSGDKATDAVKEDEKTASDGCATVGGYGATLWPSLLLLAIFVLRRRRDP